MTAAIRARARLRAAIYARQSKDRLQGIQAQVKDSKALCGLRGWDVAAVITDNDVSASSSKARKGYTRLLAMIEAGEIDVVVVTHVDRLLRKLAELEHLIDLCEKHHVAITTVSGDLDLSTDAGRLVGRILAAVARGEVERKGGRQKRANEASATEGKARKGSPRPFGWQADRVTPDPAEAAAVRDACKALLRGASVTDIARDWERRGLRPHQAPFGPLPEHPWTRTSVRQILKNPRNAGISVYKGIEVARGEWKPVVKVAVFREVARMLGDSAKQWPKGATTLLGGLAYCRCGNHVGGSTSAHGRPAYRCIQSTRGDRPGPHVFVIAADVDEIIGQAIVARLSQPGAASALMLAPAREGLNALRDEEAALAARLARLGELYADGRITEQDLITGRARGEERLAEVRTQLAAHHYEFVLTPLLAAKSTAAEWESMSTAQRRDVIGALMTVTLHPSGRGARHFDDATVLPPGRGIVWKQG